jgi:hypothetical protein
LSTHALGTSEPGPAVRHIELALLVVALPVFLLGGLPIAGYLVGGGAWVVQKGIQELLARRARGSDDPRLVLGLTVGGMIARGWLVAGAIFAVGVGDNDAGLAAAVLVILLFTVYFLVSLIMRAAP